MPLNIPMPMSTLDALMQGAKTGSSIFTAAMNPILEREKQELERERQKQQQLQFQQRMALSNAAEKRNAMLFPHQMRELENKNRLSELDNNMMDRLIGRISNNKSSESIPKDLFGQGLGVFSPEGLQEAQIDFNSRSNDVNGGFNYDALRQDPILRGYFKHKFGFDPLSPPPQTLQEKQDYEINKQLTIDREKSKAKKIDDIEKTAQSLIPYARNVQTIEDILKEKPDLTGLLTRTADFFSLTRDEDIGKFISAAQNLQSKMAKDMSSRGGFGVAKLVEQGKPNIGKSGAFNRGVTKELKESMRNSFKQMNDEYLKLTGSNLPVDFEQFYKDSTDSNKNELIKNNKNKRIKFNPVTGRLE